jgi:hypothetical protein
MRPGPALSRPLSLVGQEGPFQWDLAVLIPLTVMAGTLSPRDEATLQPLNLVKAAPITPGSS